MTFNNPSAFFVLLLAIPIVVFYVLRVRLRRVPVSAVMFWQQTFADQPPRSLWQKLRHLVSLLIQLALLACLVFALADPVAKESGVRTTVAIIDVSASMQAVGESGQSRLDLARDQLHDLIAAMGPEDQMAIVAAGPTPQLVCQLTRHPRQLDRSNRSVKATDGPGHKAAALRLAERILTNSANPQIVWISDTNPQVSISGKPPITAERIGTPLANAGIAAFQVRPLVDDLTGYECLIRVQNHTDLSFEGRVELTFNNGLIDVLPVEISPNGFWQRVLSDTAESGGIFTATLLPNREFPDALAVDNSAVAVLPRRPRIAVTLVTPGNWFLENALLAMDAVDLTVTQTPPVESDTGAVLLFDQASPETLPPGPIVVFQPQTFTELWKLRGEISEPLTGWQNEDHPLLRNVALQNVLMTNAVHIEPTVPAERIVDAVSGEPLLLKFSRESGDVVVLTTDLSQGDLPLRTAFPILLSNILASFSGGPDGFVPAVAAGSHADLSEANAVGEIAAGDQILLTAPDGTRQTQIVDSAGRIGPLEQAGVWQLSPTDLASKASAKPAQRIACNATNPAESDLRNDSQPATGTKQVALRSGKPIWQYLALLLLLAMVIEWAGFHRRVVA